MLDTESGGSQQELTGRERRTRKKRREEELPGGMQKTKPQIRSSRDRLSFDPPPQSDKKDLTIIKKKKQARRRSDFVENNDEPLNRDQRVSSKKQRVPHRLPRSVSEEVLALEGRFFPTVNKEENGKSRRPKISKGRDRSETEPVSTSDLPPSGRKMNGPRSENRKKKKPRSAVFTSAEEENYQGDLDGEISECFPVDKEDIILQNELSQSHSRINNVIAPQAFPSQPNDIMFIEKKDGQGFVRENKSKMNRHSQGRNDYALQYYQEQQRQTTTLDFMLSTHLWFRSIAMIGHGLLAGIAVGQCIFVYSLSGKSDRIFLENYYQLALPFQSIYYLLLAISTVSILDRYVNMTSGWGSFFLRLLTRPSRALALVAYLLALVFSVCLTQLDDKISLYKDIPELWDSTEEVSTWKIINLMRVIGAFIGWIMVAMAPDDDQTADTIKLASEKEDNELNQFEMSSVQTSTVQNTWDRHNNVVKS